MTRETSIESFELLREQLPEREGMVYDAIERIYQTTGHWPTNLQICAELNRHTPVHWTPADTSARRNGLICAGVVVPGERTYCEQTRRTVLTWQIKYPPKREQNQLELFQ